MAPRRKTAQATVDRTVRSRRKLPNAENTIQEAPQLFNLHNQIKNTIEKNNSETTIENDNRFEIPQLSDSDSKTCKKCNKQNGDLRTYTRDEKYSNSSENAYLQYKVECILYVYIFLTWFSHQILLQNKNTSYFNVNYLIVGQMTCSLMLGIISDFVSLKVTCRLKSLAWLVCLASSFTSYVGITVSINSILLCTSLLVSQIVLCHFSCGSASALTRLSAVRCLLDYHHVVINSVIHRLGILIWDVASYNSGLPSEQYVDQIMISCLIVGAIMCLIYFSTVSPGDSRAIQSDNEDTWLKSLSGSFFFKTCITLPSILFFYSINSGISTYSNVINLSSIGVQLTVFPLLLLVLSLRNLWKISFLLLAVLYSFMICPVSMSFIYVSLLCAVVVITQCAIIARAARGKLPPSDSV